MAKTVAMMWVVFVAAAFIVKMIEVNGLIPVLTIAAGVALVMLTSYAILVLIDD